jgi:hypothetical protein
MQLLFLFQNKEMQIEACALPALMLPLFLHDFSGVMNAVPEILIL